MGVRLFAVVYDGLLLVALWMIVSAILIPFGTSPDASAQKELTLVSATFRYLVLFPALVLTTWLFYGYFWKKAGQTLGMQTWRLKLLRFDGDLPNWSNSFSRCAAACLFPLICGGISHLAWHNAAGASLSMVLGFLGNYLWMWWSPHKLAWHDQLSGTRVWCLPPEPKKKRPFLASFSKKDA